MTAQAENLPNVRVFREYDIRGKAERDLTDSFSESLGRAFGFYVQQERGRHIVVGRDCRLSSERISDSFRRGVLSSGADVTDLGVVPSPVVYYATHTLGCDGGVVVTGSHNPPADNGFKLSIGSASLHGESIQALRRIMEAEARGTGPAPAFQAGTTDQREVLGSYQRFIEDNIKPGGRKLKVVVDGGNGTGGWAAVPIYRALGFDVVELYCEMDGRFPNHHPDPTQELNLVDLKKAVAEHKADLGLAFDGDGDRLGAVDHTGRVVWGDQLMIFFSRAVLAEHPGATIVSEVKCSRVLFDDVAVHGGIPEMWKVGHSLIKARMKETGALLAGEMSGHIFFKHRYFGYDDAVYAGARLLELLSDRSESLADMVDQLPPTVATPELRVGCSDDTKFDVVGRAATHFKGLYDVVDIDGARINFPKGWGLIRCSNTQPVLVLRFEADSADNLAAYRGEVEDWIRQNAPEVDLSRSE